MSEHVIPGSTGVGAFTPPPAPCGNPECHYVEFDCVHVRTCDPAMLLIRDQPDQGITHRYVDQWPTSSLTG